MRTLVIVVLIVMIAYSAQTTSWCADPSHPEVSDAWCSSVCTSDTCFYGSNGYCKDCTVVSAPTLQWFNLLPFIL